MPHPQEGQPYNAFPGLRLSVGDLDATAGTDAYNSVIVLEGGALTPYIVDSTAPFDLKAYFKTALGGAAYVLPGTFAVEFHIRDMGGAPVAGSPFVGGALVAETPAGAAAPAAGDIVTWRSSTVTIPGGTLAADTTYLVTIDGDDAPTSVFAFHPNTAIHTQA